MEVKVFLHEGRYIPESVIIAQTDLEGMVVVGFNKLVLEVFEEDLLLELVVAADLDEEWDLVVLATLEDFGCIVGESLFFWFVEEEVEGLDAPICALAGVGNRGKC